MGTVEALAHAMWCYEDCFAVTRDGQESRFFEAWGRGASLLRRWGLHSGEGGVIGLAAAYVGWWSFDYSALAAVSAAVLHEGGGPKGA
jgi:hypothetical protein